MSETETATPAPSDLMLTMITALLALCCAAGLWRTIAVSGLHVALDPNEGWNAYHAKAAMRGAGLYPSPLGYMVNNYPPLSFYVVGIAGRLVHDNIIAGRVLSLLAFTGTVALIVAAARDMGCRAIEALFAALLWAAYMLLETDYVGMDDPQLMGEVLSLGGLVLLLRAPRETLWLALTALLFVAAGFTKHNLIAMPLAAIVWLALNDRRSALRLVLFAAGFALAELVAFRLAFASSLFSHLAYARAWSIENVVAGLSAWIAWGFVPLAALAVLFAFERRDPFVVLCAILAAIATAFGAIAIGGDGVDVNILFDADIALALAAALFLNRFAARGFAYGWIAAMVFAAPLAVTLILAAGSDWLGADYWLHPLADDEQLAQADIAFLRTADGPVLCETLAYCYWAGKQAEVDVFSMGEEYRTGARTDNSLAALFDERHYAAIEFNSLTPFALTPHLYERLLRNYRVDHTDDDGVFLVPKKGR